VPSPATSPGLEDAAIEAPTGGRCRPAAGRAHQLGDGTDEQSCHRTYAAADEKFDGAAEYQS
jgi:hypothetical protein